MKRTFRVGLGYDAHAFAEGRALVLGGVTVPFRRGLAGHSDADVVCHSIADALLGALALGDIGQHFPDSDPEYDGISSLVLLGRVRDVIRKRGGEIVNVDAMLIIEEPSVSQYFGRMREKIAEALGVDADSVSVKATRNEALGFVGRKEGVAALSVALVGLPVANA
jgi:2-C-methyl-D-erythritol 2,4-cyclodiphosphate synthase